MGWYSGSMERMRAAWGGRCVHCPSDRKLEFAHLPGKPTGIEGRSRGQAQRYADIKRHPDCYVLLCWICHRRLDAGMELT